MNNLSMVALTGLLFCGLKMGTPAEAADLNQQVEQGAAAVKASVQSATTKVINTQLDKAQNQLNNVMAPATNAGASINGQERTEPINDLKSPEAQQAAKELGSTSWSLWRTLGGMVMAILRPIGAFIVNFYRGVVGH